MNVTKPSNTFISRISQAKKMFQSGVKTLESRAQAGWMGQSKWLSIGWSWAVGE